MSTRSNDIASFQDLLSRTQVGIWEMDIESRIFSWDETCRKIYEFDEGFYSCASKVWVDRVINEDQAIMAKNMEQVLKYNQNFDLKFRFITPTNKVKYIHSRGFKFTENGKIKLRGLHIEIDASPILSLSRMASDLSHEINNPLLIIQGKSMLLQRRIAKNDVDIECCRKDLETITQNCDRIDKIIKSITALTEHALVDSMRKVSLIKVIDEAYNTLKDYFEKNDLKISFINNFITNPNPIVDVKFDEIVRVLLDLFHNSFDAIIGQENGWVKIELKEDSNFYFVEVIDSGQNISPQIAKKMMDPFFTTKPTGRGIGLGLSVAKQIAKNHKGDLNYDSNSENTKFILSLPKAD